jgi:hypothetical protein
MGIVEVLHRWNFGNTVATELSTRTISEVEMEWCGG